MSTETLLQEVDDYLLPLPSYPPFIVKGQGMTVEDHQGNTYQDFMAGPGVLNIGHCHPDIVEAVRRQVGTLTQCPGNTHNLESIQLAKKLAEITPGDLKKVFFCNSGAEAVEGAVKIAKKYAARNGKLGLATIALEHSFHGRLSFSLSLTGIEVIQRENLVGNAAETGRYFLERLKESVDTYPFLGEARGRGLFLGVEVVKNKAGRIPDAGRAKQIKNSMRDRGYLIGVTGNFSCVIRITPPLIVTPQAVDAFMQNWNQTLNGL